MKLNVKRDQLQNAINIAQKAVSTKTTMPILECFLIEATDAGVTLTANDTELGIRTKISDCDVLEPGVIAIEARLFSEIVRKFSDDDSLVSLTTDGNIVTLLCENSTFRIQEKDPEQFPELPSVKDDLYITMSQFTLKEVIRDTIFSVAQNDSNRMMTGVLFEVKGSRLRVVTLDGHRISIRNVELRDEYQDVSVVIPGKTLNEIFKILTGENDKEVVLFFGQNEVSFRFEDTVIVSRLIDGEYFKIDSMISSDYETKLTVNRREFLDCVERSTVLIRESDKKPLIMNIESNTMTLRMNSVIGSLNAQLLVRTQGQDIMIGFNPKFLLDVMRVLDDEEVDLYLTNPKAPCFIRDEKESYIYLILPVNFNPATY